MEASSVVARGGGGFRNLFRHLGHRDLSLGQAKKIRAQARAELAEHLVAAYERRRIPWLHTAEESELLAVLDGTTDPVAAAADLLGLHAAPVAVRSLTTRGRARFPLSAGAVLHLRLEGDQRRGTAALAFGESGRCHSCHLAFAV